MIMRQDLRKFRTKQIINFSENLDYFMLTNAKKLHKKLQKLQTNKKNVENKIFQKLKFQFFAYVFFINCILYA